MHTTPPAAAWTRLVYPPEQKPRAATFEQTIRHPAPEVAIDWRTHHRTTIPRQTY